MTRFYVLFNSISGRWLHDNEKLRAMEPRYGLKDFRLKRSSDPSPLDQKPGALPTKLPELQTIPNRYSVITISIAAFWNG